PTSLAPASLNPEVPATPLPQKQRHRPCRRPPRPLPRKPRRPQHPLPNKPPLLPPRHSSPPLKLLLRPRVATSTSQPASSSTRAFASHAIAPALPGLPRWATRPLGNH